MKARRATSLWCKRPTTPNAEWTEADKAWASRAAAEVVGAGADADLFLARRGTLGVERLRTHDPNVARVRRATRWRRWVGWVVVVVAFGLGLVLDAIGAAQRVNVLAFPLIGLVAWNLCVYLLILAKSLAGLARNGPRDLGGIRRLIARAAHAIPRFDIAAGMSPPLNAFVGEWARLSWPLTGARVSRIVHSAAFVFAAGALVSLYVRGIAFEYRAGWQSTFLDADQVHRILALVLAPASAVTAIAVPDAQHIAAINYASGEGENAAPWIHLYAATIALLVLLPRALLAGIAWSREKRYTRHFPLSIAGPYFQRVLRAHRGETARIRVIPYSYQLAPQATLALNKMLTRVFGTAAELSVVPVAFGEEDNLAPDLVPTDAPALVIALFSLAATPEAENHGALVSRLIERAGARTPVIVLIDEAGFRERFSGQPERHEQRRQAWRRVLESIGGALDPIFVDLLAPEHAGAEAALSNLIDKVPAKSDSRAS